MALVVLAVSAAACGKPAPHGISEVSETFSPDAVPWNGVRVYLSSPRHASSGGRGECGWEENVNGGIFNLYAADLNDQAPGGGTLTSRGYEARVSPNTRDDGWRLNRDESDNWGANVHLVTHSNAFGAGCGDAAQYLLVMFRSGDTNSMGLRDQLLAQLDPHVPGGRNSWNCDTLGECASAAAHVAYIELFFHTNQAAVDWYQGPAGDPEASGGIAASPSVGVALDTHLGYPRSAAGLASPLDQHPGFGRSPEAALRDETIAYWEGFRREQFIASCMSDAGFEYEPAVAFPRQDMVQVAEGLGIEAGQVAASGPGEPSPWARNRSYEQALSGQERERYNQTLLGESAQDVAEADRTGIVPAGRAEDFATGGCFGAARDAVPSVWDAPRDLARSLDALVAENVGSPAMRDTSDAYDDCAQQAGGIPASGPADLEARIVAGSPPVDAVDRAYDACAPVWAGGYEDAAIAAAERFTGEQAEQLASVARRYDGVEDRIAQDDELIAYLTERVAASG